MSLTAARDTSPVPYLRAGAAALSVLLLTSVHHVYGAVIYDTPWRSHIAHISAPVGAAIALAYYIGWSRRGSRLGLAATWTGSLIALAFPVAALGIYEGGYNHVVKNIAYFGLGQEAARTLFSGAAYEMPNDFIFEATGVAQFPLAVLTAVLVVRLLRLPNRRTS
ncbi:hypothetical protein [Mesorhizobium sp. KR9-304]|uniref:hypothetical protein n=1 Tax=Mesorhizobium sp. KR9-304 TaxID=3156614 RepID=UPI0032B32C8E